MITKNERPQIKALPDKAVLVIIKQVRQGLLSIKDNHYIDGKMIGQTTWNKKSYFLSEVDGPAFVQT
jgi:hypothetical protein